MESRPPKGATLLRTLLVIALATIVVAIAGTAMFTHPLTAYTGVKLHRTGALIQPNAIDVEPGSPAYRAGLRSGDVVSCLSSRDARLLFARDIAGQMDGYEPGSSISLCVERDGSWQPASFIAETRPPAQNVYVNDWLAAFRIAGYVAFLLCAVFLVLARPGRATWTFFAYALIAAPNYAIEQNLTVLNPALYAVLYNASIVAITIQYGLLMQFAALVPNVNRSSNGQTTYRGVRQLYSYRTIPHLGVLFLRPTSSRTAAWRPFLGDLLLAAFAGVGLADFAGVGADGAHHCIRFGTGPVEIAGQCLFWRSLRRGGQFKGACFCLPPQCQYKAV